MHRGGGAGDDGQVRVPSEQRGEVLGRDAVLVLERVRLVHHEDAPEVLDRRERADRVVRRHDEPRAERRDRARARLEDVGLARPAHELARGPHPLALDGLGAEDAHGEEARAVARVQDRQGLARARREAQQASGALERAPLDLPGRALLVGQEPHPRARPPLGILHAAD